MQQYYLNFELLTKLISYNQCPHLIIRFVIFTFWVILNCLHVRYFTIILFINKLFKDKFTSNCIFYLKINNSLSSTWCFFCKISSTENLVFL